MKWEDLAPEQALIAMVFDGGNAQATRLPIALAHGADYRQVVSKVSRLIGAGPALDHCWAEFITSKPERTVWESLSDEHGKQAFIDILARSDEREISERTAHTIKEMWASTLGWDAFVDCRKAEFVDPTFLVRTRLPFERGSDPIGNMTVQILAGEGFSDLADVMDNPILWTGKSGFHVEGTPSWAINSPHLFGVVFDEFLADKGFLWRTGVWSLVVWEDGVWWTAWADMLM